MKKAQYISKILDSFGLFFCMLSLFTTYYYFELLNKNILIFSIFLFQFGLSLKVGIIISNIFNKIEKP